MPAPYNRTEISERRNGTEPGRRSSSFQDAFLDQVITRGGLRGPAGEHLVAIVDERLGDDQPTLAAANRMLTELLRDVVAASATAAEATYPLEHRDELDPERQELLAIAASAAALWHRAEGVRQSLGGG